MWPASHHAQAELAYTPKNESNADARIVRRMDNTSSHEEGLKIGPSFAFLCDELHGRRTAPWMWASGHGGHIKRAAHGYEPMREAAMWRSLGVSDDSTLGNPRGHLIR